MATATLPRRQGVSRGRWLGAGIFLIVLVIVAAVVINSRSSSATPTVATTTVATGSVVASIAGSGSVAAAQTLDLPFQSSGSVTKVATLETGLQIRVPLFIKDGEKVKVHTETREFAGRA